MMLKLKFQSFGHLMWTADSLGKSLMARKDCGQKEKRASEDEMFGWHHQCSGTNLGKLWEMVRDREAWCTAAHGVAKRQTRLGNNSNNISNHTMHFFISPPSAHSLRVCTYWLLPNVSPSMRACCVLRVLSHVWLFVALWTLVCQAPGLWNFPGKRTGVGCHFVDQGVLLTQGSNLRSLVSPALAGGFFPISDTWEAPILLWWKCNSCIIPVLHGLKASNVCLINKVKRRKHHLVATFSNYHQTLKAACNHETAMQSHSTTNFSVVYSTKSSKNHGDLNQETICSRYRVENTGIYEAVIEHVETISD